MNHKENIKIFFDNLENKGKTFKIDEEFRKNNITIPFPQRDVHFYPTQNLTQNLSKNDEDL